MQRMVGMTVLTGLSESVDTGVILCDERGRVLYCNEAARLLCGTGTPEGAVSPLSRDAYRVPGVRRAGRHRPGQAGGAV